MKTLDNNIKMKKLILILTVVISVMACNSERTAETITKEIQSKENSIETLNSEISKLEQELSELKPDSVYTGKKIPVRTLKLQTQDFDHFFEAAGELESVNEAYISPEVSGQIEKIAVQEGDKVKKGQLLAKLNTSLIEKNIEEIKTQLSFAKTMFDKQSELWDKNIGSERQYLEAKNNYESLENKLKTLRSQYNMSVITAPFAGEVEDIILKKGELAGPGVRLMQLVALDKLVVKAKLSESYISSIKEGDKVVVSFPSYSNLEINAIVSRVGNVIDKSNRTFMVEVELNNSDNRLKPNMLANITINDYNAENSIVVPSVLIKHDLSGKYLFSLKKKGNNMIATKKYITPGKSYKSMTEILSGLEAGEIVITDGYNNVSDGSVVNIIK
mgnify:CR=1 FL=1